MSGKEKKVSLELSNNGGSYELKITGMLVDLTSAANPGGAWLSWWSSGTLISGFAVDFGSGQMCPFDWINGQWPNGRQLGTPVPNNPQTQTAAGYPITSGPRQSTRPYRLTIYTKLPGNPTIEIDPEVVVDDGGKGGHKRGRGKVPRRRTLRMRPQSAPPRGDRSKKAGKKPR